MAASAPRPPPRGPAARPLLTSFVSNAREGLAELGRTSGVRLSLACFIALCLLLPASSSLPTPHATPQESSRPAVLALRRGLQEVTRSGAWDRQREELQAGAGAGDRRREELQAGAGIDSDSLRVLDLSRFGESSGNAKGVPVLGCKGGECPTLGSCVEGGIGIGSENERKGSSPDKGGIEACGNTGLLDESEGPEEASSEGGCPTPGDLSHGQLFLPGCHLAAGDLRSVRWGGQVVVLRNVFVSAHGAVFNQTHRFLPGGCIQDSTLHPQFRFPPGTKITEHAAVVNIAIGWYAKHRLFELMKRLPLLLALSAFMPRLRHASFLLGDYKQLSAFLTPFIGVHLREKALHFADGERHIVLARELYQPIHQACGSPSPAVWALLRSHFLLPDTTLPLLKPDWSPSLSWQALPLSKKVPPGIPDNWVVVLGAPPSSLRVTLVAEHPGYYAEAQTLDSIVHSNFWLGRVHAFSSDSDPSQVRALFCRAMLLIGTPGAALAYMPFMPQGAVVIVLEPARKGEGEPAVHHSGMSAEMRGFARACGLSHISLFCNKEEDPSGGLPSLSCKRGKVLEALSWAAGQLYNSPTLPGADSRGALKDRIPGSGLMSASAVKQFRDWMECATEKGRWEMDSRPRHLPWRTDGSTEKCEKRHMDAVEGAVAFETADVIADDPQASPAEWKVREGLKYRWRVPPSVCRGAAGGKGDAQQDAAAWLQFDPDAFCQLVGRKLHILLLGDSIQNQFQEALLNNLLVKYSKQQKAAFFNPTAAAAEAVNGSVKAEIHSDCIAWLNNATTPHEYCRVATFEGSFCPGLTIEFIRNDLLTVFEDEGEPSFDRMPWATALKGHLDAADIIIFNRGPHYTPSARFTRELEATSRLLRELYPSKLLVYRDTPPGHLNCTQHHRPLSQRQDPGPLPYNWGMFAMQNSMAKQIVETLGIVYMNVDTMTALRADGHKGFWPEINFLDCLHYCHPGPIDSWAELLYNMLRRLKWGQR